MKQEGQMSTVLGVFADSGALLRNSVQMVTVQRTIEQRLTDYICMQAPEC